MCVCVGGGYGSVTYIFRGFSFSFFSTYVFVGQRKQNRTSTIDKHGLNTVAGNERQGDQNTPVSPPAPTYCHTRALPETPSQY